MAEYLLLRGLSYVPVGGKTEVRREPGETVDDLPPKSIEWLQRDFDGHGPAIEPTTRLEAEHAEISAEPGAVIPAATAAPSSEGTTTPAAPRQRRRRNRKE